MKQSIEITSLNVALGLCSKRRKLRKIQFRLMTLLSVGTFIGTLGLLVLNTEGGQIKEKPTTIAWIEPVPTDIKSCLEKAHTSNECVEEHVSEADKVNFKRVEKFIEEKNFSEAEQAIESISEKALKETATAGLLLTGEYKASPESYKKWLISNNSHPLIPQIEEKFKKTFGGAYKLAQKEIADEKAAYAKKSVENTASEINQVMSAEKADTAQPSKSKIDSSVTGKSAFKLGLNVWAKGQYKDAALYFNRALKTADSSHDKSAAAFWAYRASYRAADFEKAGQYLQTARRYRPTFYAMLAEQINQKHKALPNAKKLKLDEKAFNKFLESEAASRVIAHEAVGLNKLAVMELTKQAQSFDPAKQAGSVLLAQKLDITLSNEPSKQTPSLVRVSEDSFPIPEWKPVGGFKVAPALLYAIIKKESGFASDLVSPMGAVGLMQILPNTANAISGTGDKSEIAELLKNPSQNVIIGQKYLQHLMGKKSIGNNMFYLLTAYNAGPGNFMKWRKDINCKNDPLLFIEMIPAKQTRDYVQQVMSGYWVYTGLLGKRDVTLAQLADGSWPRHSLN